jgi:multiple sugar transport system substrate-binding protein
LIFFAVFILFGVVTSAQDPVTVTVWMHNHAPRVAIDEELIAQFMEDNPDIIVDYQVIESDFFTQLQTALASGAGPDVFNQFTLFNAQYYAQGMLAPVDPVAMGYETIEDVYARYGEGDVGKTVLAGDTFNGILYGLPTELSNYACYTNDDLWAEAGLDPATDFPATWEGLIDVAKQLTIRDDSGALVQRGFDFNWSANIYMMLHFDPMVQQLGPSMIDEETYTAHINTPEVARVMQYWSDLVNVYELGGPQYTTSRDAFNAGELATECTFGNWGVPGMQEAGINFSIHNIPRFEDAVNDIGFATYAYYLQVNANSPREVQEAGWKLIAYLTSHPDRYLNEAALFQPIAEYTQSEEFANNEIMPVFLDELYRGAYHPRFAGFSEVGDALGRARDRVVLGGEDIETVLQETEDEVNAILDRALADIEAAGGG